MCKTSCLYICISVCVENFYYDNHPPSIKRKGESFDFETTEDLIKTYKITRHFGGLNSFCEIYLRYVFIGKYIYD